jgi:hypothetical protein
MKSKCLNMLLKNIILICHPYLIFLLKLFITQE